MHSHQVTMTFLMWPSFFIQLTNKTLNKTWYKVAFNLKQNLLFCLQRSSTLLNEYQKQIKCNGEFLPIFLNCVFFPPGKTLSPPNAHISMMYLSGKRPFLYRTHVQISMVLGGGGFESWGQWLDWRAETGRWNHR